MRHVYMRLFLIWQLGRVSGIVDLKQLFSTCDHHRLDCSPADARSAQYEATVGDQEIVIVLFLYIILMEIFQNIFL